MKKTFRDYVKKSIEVDRKRLKIYKAMADTRVTGTLNARYDKRRNRYSYYYKGTGDMKEQYVKLKPNAKVWKLQQKRFAQEMIKVLETNIRLKEEFCRLIIPDVHADVLASIPKAYRPNPTFRPKPKSARKEIKQSENPFRREELKETTTFGLNVRTKGELAIAELLYSLGSEFYYEKGLTLRVPTNQTEYIDGKKATRTVWIRKTFYPDFTIPLPDGSIVYWEHKGMLSKRKYLERDMEKEIAYNVNLIYQPHNLMVTAEGPNNEIDLEAVRRIIDGWLMPLLAM